MSGPLRDRLDLVVEEEAVPIAELTQCVPGEPAAAVRARVVAARRRQLARAIQSRVNATLSGLELKKVAPLGTGGRQLLELSAERLHLPARAFHRVIRVARTLADLADTYAVITEHIDEALQYRLIEKTRAWP